MGPSGKGVEYTTPEGRGGTASILSWGTEGEGDFIMPAWKKESGKGFKAAPQQKNNEGEDPRNALL